MAWPALAEEHGIEDGDRVWLHSRRGRACGRARVTPDIRPDTVFMPFHWAGPGRANALTRRTTDPVSGMPAFKTAAVRVEAAK